MKQISPLPKFVHPSELELNLSSKQEKINQLFCLNIKKQIKEADRLTSYTLVLQQIHTCKKLFLFQRSINQFQSLRCKSEWALFLPSLNQHSFITNITKIALVWKNLEENLWRNCLPMRNVVFICNMNLTENDWKSYS